MKRNLKVAFLNFSFPLTRYQSSSSIFLDVLDGLSRAARMLHLDLVVTTFDSMPEALLSFVAEKAWLGLDGVVVFSSLLQREHLAALNKLRTACPTVFILSDPGLEGANLVSVDDSLGMQMVAEHLYSEGFRRPGFVDLQRTAYSQRRFLGFIEGWGARGIGLNDGGVVGFKNDGSLDPDAPTIRTFGLRPDEESLDRQEDRFLEHFLQSNPELDCVATTEDYTALRVMALVMNKFRGRRIAVTGFDDLEWRSAEAGLTSVHQDFRQIGFHAVTMLHEIVAGLRPAKGQILLETPRLIARSSSLNKDGPVPAEANAILKDQIHAYLVAHSHEPEVTRDVSRAFRHKHAYFLHKFHLLFGTDLKTFLAGIRIEKAKVLLRGTQVTITDIAFAVGFNSSTYFSVVFRESTGVTPQQYRSAPQATASNP